MGIQTAITQPLRKGIYKHFRGRFYQVLATAVHSKTQEEMVVYQALYEPFDTFVRPRQMFEDVCPINQFGEKGPRFQFIRET